MQANSWDAGLDANNRLLVNYATSVTMGQVCTGRAQYAITLEGEELGHDKSLITGRASEIPFTIDVEGSKSLEK